MKITAQTTVEEFLPFLKLITEEQLKELDRLPMPDGIGAIPFSQNLKEITLCRSLIEITYGQRVRLTQYKTEADFYLLPFSVLYGKDEAWVARQPIAAVHPFCRMVANELIKLNKRDQITFKYNPTPEEKRAGIDKLSYGVFGTMDQIAQRMHISHDEVENLPEIRVFAMLKKDFETAMYQRRLQKEYNRKHK